MINGKTNINLLYGGSFYPPTIAHIRIAEYLSENSDISQICVAPSWRNPFKSSSYADSFKLRVEMSRNAFSGINKVIVTDIEESLHNLLGEESVRTIDFLEFLTWELNGGNVSYMPVIGGDCLNEFRRWKGWETILDEYGLVVVERPGTYIDKEWKTEEYKEKIYFVEVPDLVEISSTKVREMVREGKDISRYVCPENIRLIQENNLFVQ